VDNIILQGLGKEVWKILFSFSIEVHIGGICIHDISMDVQLLFKIYGRPNKQPWDNQAPQTSGAFWIDNLWSITTLIFKKKSKTYLDEHKLKEKRKKNYNDIGHSFYAKKRDVATQRILLVVKIVQNEMRIVFNHLTMLQKVHNSPNIMLLWRLQIHLLDIIQPPQVVKVEYCKTSKN
jgi:hypothetical protein